MKTKSKLLCAALAALCMIFAIALMPAAAAFADDRPAGAEYSRSAVSADERGILTIMNISFTSGNGSVTVTATNQLTIFPATVFVRVELYRSQEYCPDYRDMRCVSTKSIGDLDMGNSISASYSTSGEQMYWMGRAMYTVDGGAAQELFTPVYILDGDGNVLGQVA